MSESGVGQSGRRITKTRSTTRNCVYLEQKKTAVCSTVLARSEKAPFHMIDELIIFSLGRGFEISLS